MSGSSPATLVADLNSSSPNNGKGPWRFIPIPLTSLRTAADPPAILTGATTNVISYASGALKVLMPDTTANLIDLTMPWDAQSMDPASASPYTKGVEWMLVGSARIANAAETAIMAATAYAQTHGTYSDASDTTASTKALSAAFTGAFKRFDITSPTPLQRVRVASTTAFSQAANAVDVFAVDFSDALDSGNLRFQPGDAMTILLALSGTAVGNVHLLSLGMAYRSNIAFTNRALRAY